MLLNKSHTIFGFVLVFFFTVSCRKDSPSEIQKEQFLKYFGGVYQDAAIDVVLYNNNYYILGNLADKDGNSTIFLTKTDDFGNRIWEKEFSNGAVSASANQLLKLENQPGLAIIGSVLTDETTFYTDMYLLIVNDVSGEILKQKVYNDTLYESGKYIAELATGELVIAGLGATSLTNTPFKALFITTDINGENIRPFPSVTKATTITMNGICHNNTADTIYITGSKDGKSQIFIVYPDGTYITPTPISFNGQINGMVKNSLGQHFICGTSTIGSIGKNDVMVAQISSNEGPITFIWQKEFGSSGDDKGYNIGLTTWDNILITGTQQNVQLNTTDIYLVECNYSGELVKDTVFGGQGNEIGIKSIEATDERIVTLSTNYFSSNSLITLMKWDWK